MELALDGHDTSVEYPDVGYTGSLGPHRGTGRIGVSRREAGSDAPVG